MSPLDWRVSLRHRLNHALPASIVDEFLLTFPFLYKSLNYESNLSRTAIAELLSRLNTVYRLEGDIVECGSARGGTTVIMAKFLQSNSAAKRIYACDSFAGFDRRELALEREAGLTAVSDSAFTHTSAQYVLKKARRLGVGDMIVPVVGFFQKTLGHLDGKWCFGFVDCDLRDSVTFCAETLWPRLVSGGVLVFDDYVCDYFRGAKAAVDLFVEIHKNEIADHGLSNELYYVRKADGTFAG